MKLAILNSMAGGDFEAALDRHVEWGLRQLDLKDEIFGKAVADLADGEAERAAAMMRARDLSAHCLSTVLFHREVEEGESVFAKDLDKLDRVLAVAAILRPRAIRLLAAGLRSRHETLDSVVRLRARHAWLFDLYGEAVDRIAAAGYCTLIENEVGRCILARPQEVIDFFACLDRPATAGFTWDVQNLWQMGTFPTLSVYRQLRPVITMVHLKGGRSERPGGPLRWAAYLEHASWPVLEIVRAVAVDGVSPVICLNPSHGEPCEAYAHDYEREIGFLRREIPEIR